MALENLDPVTRFEAILDGYPLPPVTRREYFLQKAANQVPKSEASESGNTVYNVMGDYVTKPLPLKLYFTAVPKTNSIFLHYGQSYSTPALILSGCYNNSGKIKVSLTYQRFNPAAKKLKFYRIFKDGDSSELLTYDSEYALEPATLTIPSAYFGNIHQLFNTPTAITAGSSITIRAAVVELDADDNEIGPVIYTAQIVYKMEEDSTITRVKHYLEDTNYIYPVTAFWTNGSLVFAKDLTDNSDGTSVTPVSGAYNVLAVVLSNGQVYSYDVLYY